MKPCIEYFTYFTLPTGPEDISVPSSDLTPSRAAKVTQQRINVKYSRTIVTRNSKYCEQIKGRG